MNKLTKITSIILCLCFMLSVMSACGGQGDAETNDSISSSGLTEESVENESGSDFDPSYDSTSNDDAQLTEESSSVNSETAAEIEEITTEQCETEYVDELVCFVDYVRESARTYHDLKVRGDAAISFTVPDGYLTKLYLNLTDYYGYTLCSINVNIYHFTGSYRSTVEDEPIYSEYITSSLRTYNIFFEEGQIPAGDYLIVLSYVEPEITTESHIAEHELVESETVESQTESETTTDGDTSTESDTEATKPEEKPEIVYHGKVIQDNFWYGATIPEEYKKYNMISYMDGRTNKRSAFCGGFEVTYPVEKSITDNDAESSLPDDEIEMPENTAKVILIGGQSNATGATRAPFLKNNVSEEKYQEYVDGFSNVQILYSSGALSSGNINIPNKIYDFVDCKLGQGIASNAFGPELGLAAYLSETYPDETFYIIKYAIGSSGLRAHWNPTDEEKNSCLLGFKETVDYGLGLLEDQGLDPRIVAFLWMQGESDASTAFSSYDYFNLQKALVEHIRDEYAFYEASRGIAFIDASVCTDGIWSTAFLINETKRRYSLESDINFYIDINDYGITGLEENNDPAHFDSLSMILLGELFGKELSKVLD